MMKGHQGDRTIRDPHAQSTRRESRDDDAEAHDPLRALPAHILGDCGIRTDRQLATYWAERIPIMTTITITTRYVRYVLSSLAAIAFGMSTK
jgi:hypothetical protein